MNRVLKTRDVAEVVKHLQNPKKHKVVQVVSRHEGRSWTIAFHKNQKINPGKTDEATILYEDGKLMSWGQDFLAWAPELIEGESK